MSEPTILTDVEGAIGIITVNRPKRLNALDLATIGQMESFRPARASAYRRLTWACFRALVALSD